MRTMPEIGAPMTAYDSEGNAALVSIAISLKRIADILKDIHQPKAPDGRSGGYLVTWNRGN